jgi:predicted branched-subunit amino acid permease
MRSGDALAASGCASRLVREVRYPGHGSQKIVRGWARFRRWYRRPQVEERAEAIDRRASFAAGARAGIPFAVGGCLVAFSFGIIAQPVVGAVAAIVMSFVIFAGSAQFAAIAVLSSGGTAAAAIVAGTLLNLRFVPMGISIAPWIRKGPLGRALRGQAIVDASWAMSNRGEGRFDVEFLVGATSIQYVTWTTGTIAGVLGRGLIGNPDSLGLDAVFPAFFLALLAPELKTARGRRVAACGVLIAIALTPVTPAGVPIIAASLATVAGLRG